MNGAKKKKKKKKKTSRRCHAELKRQILSKYAELGASVADIAAYAGAETRARYRRRAPMA